MTPGGPVFRDHEGNIVTVSENNYKQVQEYFEIVGSKQGASIRVSNIAGYKGVQFCFMLPENVEAGLIYSPDGNVNWQPIEEAWYVFSYGMV
jgi:hypothetical protein